ncbi:MAG TPA: hypothetical protein VFP50_19445 [Anaeromyxobacteraceae bacterium]|nr:hypothetical protein [Anaeromyxobacteraceae bacterium]
MPATLEGAAVTATEIDLTVAGVTDYTIACVNAAATPHRMYMGDHRGTNDGSTPALRTPTLDGSRYFSKQ